MSMLLQVILSSAITIITVFLVLLLIQARRTAASVQRFAEGAAQDLHQACEDVHAIRLRTEEVSLLAKQSLEHPSLLTQVITGLVSGVKRSLDRKLDSERWLEALVTGLQSALHLLRGRQTEPQKEGAHE